MIIDFIDNVIVGEKLRPQDIVMLKFLKRVGGQVYTIYKIFKSIDVRQIQRLLFNIKIYADGFFGRNMDYSEDIDPLELDIIEAFEGGCSKTQININSPTQRVIHPKSSNNNCFFKCIQPYVPLLRERITKSNCNAIRARFQMKLDAKIDIQTALQIFQHYRENTTGLKIWKNNTLLGKIEGNPVLNLSLENEHYALLEVKQYQRCKECGRTYKPNIRAIRIEKCIIKSSKEKIDL